MMCNATYDMWKTIYVLYINVLNCAKLVNNYHFLESLGSFVI
jgi:hypothetical protein